MPKNQPTHTHSIPFPFLLFNTCLSFQTTSTHFSKTIADQYLLQEAMLDQTELRKYFNQDQIEDMLNLHLICQQTPPGRIRRARVRKVDPNHIPRPVNSFMTYRSEKQALIRKFCPTANHREISKMLAKWWHNISSSEKNLFIERAKTAKQVHGEK